MICTPLAPAPMTAILLPLMEGSFSGQAEEWWISPWNLSKPFQAGKFGFEEVPTALTSHLHLGNALSMSKNSKSRELRIHTRAFRGQLEPPDTAASRSLANSKGLLEIGKT
uniref:Uncharacterized protein n=1 Tax=Fusarium oxysporum (strain Fo5176) TaxID=660025 RepID=A0A0D2YD44_FUSOF